MSIGFALAGFALLAAAAHPRGVRQLMGTPEEHLVKFHEYMSFAQNADLPRRIRIGFIERAWAEAEWATVPSSDTNALVRLQSEIELSSDVPSPSFPSATSARMMVAAPAKSRRKVRDQCDDGTAALHDRRHPPKGWTLDYKRKGTWWLVSLGNGFYNASSSDGRSMTGTGNSVIGKIHGYCVDFYKATNLGNPGQAFNPANPPHGWYL